jgi:hypothetical protein
VAARRRGGSAQSRENRREEKRMRVEAKRDSVTARRQKDSAPPPPSFLSHYYFCSALFTFSHFHSRLHKAHTGQSMGVCAARSSHPQLQPRNFANPKKAKLTKLSINRVQLPVYHDVAINCESIQEEYIFLRGMQSACLHSYVGNRSLVTFPAEMGNTQQQHVHHPPPPPHNFDRAWKQFVRTRGVFSRRSGVHVRTRSGAPYADENSWLPRNAANLHTCSSCRYANDARCAIATLWITPQYA